MNIENLFNENFFFKGLKERYNSGEQTAILTEGETNSGKTVWNVILYYLVKKGILNEKVEDLSKTKMYFSITEFARSIDKISDEVVFYDEAGTELDIGEWNSIFNKTLRHILQTQRVKRNFYFIIVPHKRYITYTNFPLFNFLFTVRKHPVMGKEGNVEGYEREASLYKIHTQYFKMIGSDYYYFRKLFKFRIPEIDAIKNKDFHKLYKKFHEIELKKKQNIAKDIKEETEINLMKEQTKKEKARQQYKKVVGK